MLKRYWHACETPGRNSVDYNTRQMRWELWFVAGRCCLLKAVNAALLGEAVGPLCLFLTSCTPRIWCPNGGTLEFDTALRLMLFVEITTSKQEISSAVLLLSKLLVRSSYLIPGKTMIVRKQQQQKKQVAEGCGLQKVASREVYVSEAKHRWCVLGQRDTWKSRPEKELQPATLWWDDDSGNEHDFFNVKKNMLKISSRMRMCYIVKCYGHSC